MRFKIFYCIYFIVCLFYANLMVFGLLSVRHFLAVVMLVICISEGAKVDKFLKWYFVFLLFCLISALSTGFVGHFLSKLLGTYLVAIVLYMATKIMILKYHAQKWVLNVVLVVACINSIFAIAQFYNLPFASSIRNLLGIQLEEGMNEYYESFEDFRGRYVGGLLGVVYSGYFLSAACVLSLCASNDKTKILSFVIFLLNFYALYLVQQRSGFFVGLMCIAFYVIITMNRSRREKYFYITLLLLAFLSMEFLGNQVFSFEEMRYSTIGLEDNYRRGFSKKGWEFFLANPLGGIYAFRAAGNIDPHNLFVNALLYGGLFGGVLILVYIVYQLVLVSKIMIDTYRSKKYSSLLLAFSLAYLCYTINSLFHNMSLLYGDVMYFLLWGGIVSLLEVENRKSNQSMCNMQDSTIRK